MSNAEREEPRERDRKCVYICVRERERKLCRMIVPKASTGWGIEAGEAPGYRRALLISKNPKSYKHTHIHTHTVWGRDAIKENTIGLEFSFPNPI